MVLGTFFWDLGESSLESFLVTRETKRAHFVCWVLPESERERERESPLVLAVTWNVSLRRQTRVLTSPRMDAPFASFSKGACVPPSRDSAFSPLPLCPSTAKGGSLLQRREDQQHPRSHLISRAVSIEDSRGGRGGVSLARRSVARPLVSSSSAAAALGGCADGAAQAPGAGPRRRFDSEPASNSTCRLDRKGSESRFEALSTRK